MDEDDYESLPPTATHTDHMIAGAAAGIMEHCIIYPVDVVKVIRSIKLIYSLIRFKLFLNFHRLVCNV
jgi:hypothetical protein